MFLCYPHHVIGRENIVLSYFGKQQLAVLCLQEIDTNKIYINDTGYIWLSEHTQYSVWSLVPVRQALEAAIVGLKCEKGGQGHSTLNTFFLQVKLRLFRERELLCLINDGLMPLLWS